MNITGLPVATTIDPVGDVIPIVTANINTTQQINRNTFLGIASNPVGLTDTQTLTNKTLTSPAVNNPVLGGTVTGTYTLGGTPTFPSSVVTLTGTQTLTNKTLTSPTINSPTITNASITADTITGFTSANTGTIYGISVSGATVSGSFLTNSSVTSNKLSLTKNTADANGWIKRDYGSWQTYERTQTVTSQVVPANSYATIATLSIPVGITDTSSLRFQCGVLGGFAGRIFPSLDNSNQTIAVTTMSLMLGNLTTGSITFNGFVYVYAITV